VSPLSKLPCELDVAAALDESRSVRSSRIYELEPVIACKILTEQTDGQALQGMPGEPGINPGVRRNPWIVETAHEVCRGVPRQVVRESKVRSKLRRIYRAAPLRGGYRCGVLARRIQVHMNLFERIPGAERPTIGYLPVSGDLQSLRFPMHQIFKSRGYEQVRRRWGRFENRWSWFNRLLMGVIAVKGREIDRETFQ
jgi:hypothetical protein